MKEFTPRLGTSLEVAAKQAIELACSEKGAVAFKFNDIKLTVQPWNRVSDVCEDWTEACRLSAEIQGGGITAKLPTDLSLRDYFAAKALAGLLSTFISEEVCGVVRAAAESHGRTVPEHVSVQAYQFADEMLKARGN